METIADRFDVAPGQVEVEKAVKSGEALMVLVSVEEDRQVTRASGVLIQVSGGWRVDNMNVGTWRGPRARPGSGELPLLRMAPSGSPTVAFGGFIDPEITRLETVSASRRTFDADVPAKGATIVLAEHGVQLRVYRGDDLVFAFPLVEGVSEVTRAGELGEEAREAAEDFLIHLVSGESRAAGDYVSQLITPDLLLPPLLDILTSPPTVPRGSVATTRGSFVIDLQDSSGRVALLELWMTRESANWKVLDYHYMGPAGVTPVHSGDSDG